MQHTANGRNQRPRMHGSFMRPSTVLITASTCVFVLFCGQHIKAQVKPLDSGKTPQIEHKSPGETIKPSASSKVMQIKKQISGEFTYRIVPAGGNASPDSYTAPITFPAPSAADSPVAIALPANVNPANSQLEILDIGRNTLARLPINVKDVVTLSESSFTFAQRINVPVQYKGLGVIGAQVTMSSASKKYTKSTILQAGDNGVARFDNVPLNEPIAATVSFGTHPPQSMTKTLASPITTDSWSPISIDWADIKTVPAPPSSAITNTSSPAIGQDSSANSGHNSETRQVESNPMSSIISTVLGLAFIVAVVYGLLWAYRTGKLKTFLDKLGLHTDPLASGGANMPSPFDVKSRTPIQPITEGTADPFSGLSLTGGGAPVIAAAGPRLVATMGTYAGSIFPITNSSIDMGRDASNGVPLPNDNNASRRHATIEQSAGIYTVTDHGSSNGTFLNGVRIASENPLPLQPGDEVQIGMTRFRFEV